MRCNVRYALINALLNETYCQFNNTKIVVKFTITTMYYLVAKPPAYKNLKDTGMLLFHFHLWYRNGMAVVKMPLLLHHVFPGI